MEGERYLCPNCGIPVEATKINFKTRRAQCDFCGKEIVFPRRTSTASPSATHALNEARRFFLEKNFSSAKSCAETVVSMMPANLPALFIVAYYNAFIADVKSRSSLDTLFRVTFPDAEMEQEEEEIFKELILKTVLHTCDYEEEIVCRFIEYDDAKEAVQFIETFSPFVITKRTNTSFLTPRLVNAYLTLSRHSDIPKTWYALLMSITKNPDSPMATGAFYLKTKTENFYHNYLLPVGSILNAISNQELKAKFVGVYNKTKADFESKMQQ